MKRFSAMVLLLVLAACGGGGDSAPATTPTATTAEGFWSGAASTGRQVSVVVLDNGETWGVVATGGSIVGALYGNTTYSGGTLSGSGREFNIPSRTVTSGTYTGTFTAKSVLSISTSGGVQFPATYGTSYDQAASLAALAGNFSGSGTSGSSPVQTVSVSITSAGTISVPGTSGCSASGTAVPRPGGKNVFNVSVTFSGSSCALGNGTLTTGIAYYDATTRQLLVMALNGSKSDGFIYLGTK
jgi:hypothetical protein